MGRSRVVKEFITLERKVVIGQEKLAKINSAHPLLYLVRAAPSGLTFSEQFNEKYHESNDLLEKLKQYVIDLESATTKQ